MRVRAAAATAALLLAALTACGGNDGDGKAEAEPAAKESAAKSSTKKVDCSDEGLSQAEWMKSCSGEGGGASAGPEEGAGGSKLAWGKVARTTGYQDPDSGGGNLDVTPTTVVYQSKAMGSEASNGVFAIITVKDAAAGDAAATENAPAAGGGWQWIAPDGETVSSDNGEAVSITPEGFDGERIVQPGAWVWRTVAFDISEAQRGGTLVYVDGLEEAFRWKVPTRDAGPDVAKLKKGMEGDY
ncbi:hypothetical protein ACIRLA_21790 [Streptomyces sp. NPDC102364]|uniref:hypothetical protein n=1 Tax=Streptomyces sp. NPDC102364 TaxID=3366161 RepID=UPI00381845AD